MYSINLLTGKIAGTAVTDFIPAIAHGIKKPSYSDSIT
jgi:hypothetical protein